MLVQRPAARRRGLSASCCYHGYQTQKCCLAPRVICCRICKVALHLTIALLHCKSAVQDGECDSDMSPVPLQVLPCSHWLERSRHLLSLFPRIRPCAGAPCTVKSAAFATGVSIRTTQHSDMTTASRCTPNQFQVSAYDCMNPICPCGSASTYDGLQRCGKKKRCGVIQLHFNQLLPHSVIRRNHTCICYAVETVHKRFRGDWQDLVEVRWYRAVFCDACLPIAFSKDVRNRRRRQYQFCNLNHGPARRAALRDTLQVHVEATVISC